MEEQVRDIQRTETEEKEGESNSLDEEEVWSWGAGTDGQLGTGRLEDDHIPQLFTSSLSSTGAMSLLACGGAHVIALTFDGKVLTWGRGTSGQLAHGDTANCLSPKVLTFFHGHKIIHAAAGWSHSGFVSDSGALFTCGDGSFGQLGNGAYSSSCSPARVPCFDDKRVKQVACGLRHSLVLLEDRIGNQVYAFGAGKRGQLGISTDQIKSVNVPVLTLGFKDVEITSVSANGDHSVALSAEGSLYTWGRGFGGGSDSQYPQRLDSSLSFTEAALGWNHALVLTGDGEVFMLGGTRHGALSTPEASKPERNTSGMLVLDNSTKRKAGLEKVAGLEEAKVIQIAAGAEHSALVTENGEIKTWGWGEHGQLGLGNTFDQTNPQTVNLGHRIQTRDTKIYCGSGFTYVVRRYQTL